MKAPRLYAIVDAEVLAAREVSLEAFAEELRAARVTLVQYRDKVGSPQEVLRGAGILRKVFGKGVFPESTMEPSNLGHPILIMNDRADLAVLAAFDGVHVGQEDLSPEDARRVLCHRTGCPTSDAAPSPLRWGYSVPAPSGIVGLSTHNEAQLRAADVTSADYVAIGPIFPTGSKLNPGPVVGLDGVRRARALTAKPIVAIGGIARANARSVIDAGADSVAAISGLFAPGESVEKVARDFLDILR